MPNEFDDLVPNLQTPKKSCIGYPNNNWDEVYAKVGYYETIMVSGQQVESYDSSMVQAILGIGINKNVASDIYIVEHNLGTPFVDVQVYNIEKELLVPDVVRALDENRIEVRFVVPELATILIQKGKSL